MAALGGRPKRRTVGVQTKIDKLLLDKATEYFDKQAEVQWHQIALDVGTPTSQSRLLDRLRILQVGADLDGSAVGVGQGVGTTELVTVTSLIERRLRHMQEQLKAVQERNTVLEAIAGRASADLAELPAAIASVAPGTGLEVAAGAAAGAASGTLGPETGTPTPSCASRRSAPRAVPTPRAPAPRAGGVAAETPGAVLGGHGGQDAREGEVSQYTGSFKGVPSALLESCQAVEKDARLGSESAPWPGSPSYGERASSVPAAARQAVSAASRPRPPSAGPAAEGPEAACPAMGLGGSRAAAGLSVGVQCRLPSSTAGVASGAASGAAEGCPGHSPLGPQGAPRHQGTAPSSRVPSRMRCWSPAQDATPQVQLAEATLLLAEMQQQCRELCGIVKKIRNEACAGSVLEREAATLLERLRSQSAHRNCGGEVEALKPRTCSAPPTQERQHQAAIAPEQGKADKRLQSSAATAQRCILPPLLQEPPGGQRPPRPNQPSDSHARASRGLELQHHAPRGRSPSTQAAGLHDLPRRVMKEPSGPSASASPRKLPRPQGQAGPGRAPSECSTDSAGSGSPRSRASEESWSGSPQGTAPRGALRGAADRPRVVAAAGPLWRAPCRDRGGVPAEGILYRIQSARGLTIVDKFDEVGGSTRFSHDVDMGSRPRVWL